MFGLKTFAFYQLGVGRRIPTVDPLALLSEKENQTVLIQSGLKTIGGVSLQEEMFLLSLAIDMKCKTVFELGTCTGLTTYNLALNVQGTVYTLDLPASVGQTVLPVGNADRSFMGIDAEAKYWIGRPHADRIIQLHGDSAAFDFVPYHGRIDFVFVDGAHSYPYVWKDSHSALAMVREGGAIVWHDYAPCWPGVVQALNKLSTKVPLVHLRGTSLVIYKRQSAAAYEEVPHAMSSVFGDGIN